MPYIPDDDSDSSGLGAASRMFEEPYYEYWYHLGRFLHSYSIAEAELLSLLTHISGLSGIEAGIVFHGTRCEAARNLITKLLTATNQEEKLARLKVPFDQMAVIGTVRNNLVHWGAEVAPDGTFLVSNASRSPVKPMYHGHTHRQQSDDRRDETCDFSRTAHATCSEKRMDELSVARRM